MSNNLIPLGPSMTFQDSNTKPEEKRLLPKGMPPPPPFKGPPKMPPLPFTKKAENEGEDQKSAIVPPPFRPK